MQIENSQCKLAQAQIGLYVAGEALPEDVLTSLEAHLDDCENCRAIVREQRTALEVRASTADGQEADIAPDPIDPPNATDAFPEPAHQATSLGADEEANIAETIEASAPTKPNRFKLPAFQDALRGARSGQRKFGHPLIWSGALAVILVAMSFVAKNPSMIFGKKAIAADSTTKTAPSKEDTAKETHGYNDTGESGKPKEGALPNSSESSPHLSATHGPKESDDHVKVEPVKQDIETDTHDTGPSAPVMPTVKSVKSSDVRRVPTTEIRRSNRSQAPARPRNDVGSLKVYDAAGNLIQP